MTQSQEILLGDQTKMRGNFFYIFHHALTLLGVGPQSVHKFCDLSNTSLHMLIPFDLNCTAVNAAKLTEYSIYTSCNMVRRASLSQLDHSSEGF